MRVWIDTEFNGFQGDLISIGLIAEDGQYLYCVRHETQNMDIDPWVEEHVMPNLDKTLYNGGALWKDDFTIQYQLQKFLNSYDGVEIIVDWPEDIKHLCDLMITGPGLMINTPPMTFTLDRSIDGNSRIPHNAIFDALSNMEFCINREIDE
ncbi:MAG: hypothetical protein R3230_01095 [Nitrosopumilaceae archaeon]|nr:hypothetical protein [Nitrosopumilaceae archaeon]